MKIFLSSLAQQGLLGLPEEIQQRIIYKIKFFAVQDNPLLFTKHIGGKIYRFRVGDYRILFEIKNKEMYVAKIDRRDKIYR